MLSEINMKEKKCED